LLAQELPADSTIYQLDLLEGEQLTEDLLPSWMPCVAQVCVLP
jgi:hypothetical protein